MIGSDLPSPAHPHLAGGKRVTTIETDLPLKIAGRYAGGMDLFYSRIPIPLRRQEDTVPYTPDELKRAIEQGLPQAVAYIEDLKGTGDHFNAVVISPEFEGKSAVEQHRMVHRAMKEIIEGDLHAFHLKTYSPAAAERAGVSMTDNS